LPKISEDQNPSTVARQLLSNTTELIEEVRNTHSPTASLPQVIHVGRFTDDDDSFSAYKAAVLSTESFLHSYAISYRMDIRLIRFHEQTLFSEFERLAREVLEISSSASQEPAKIYNLQSSISEKSQVSIFILK
jgi:hypothetical protein